MPFSTRTMTAMDWAVIKYFKPVEFRNPEKMGYEFMIWLDKFREKANVPMTITSSYRTPEYNKLVGGASDSAHTDIPCEAVDIGMRPRQDDLNWNYTRFQLMTKAVELGCTRIGMYANGSLHFDLSKRPSPRIWVVVSGHPS